MSSFKRSDYLTIFHSAAYIWEVSPKKDVKEIAAQIMDLCEDAIGQQLRPDRPHQN